MLVLRAGDPRFLSCWHSLTSACSQQRLALYGEANLAYYREYVGNDRQVDHSFMVVEGENPVAGMRMFLRKTEGGASELSCCGLPVCYLESAETVSAFRAGAHKLVKGELLRLMDSPECPDLVLYRDLLEHGELSYPSRVLLDLGAQVNPGFTQVIDLSRSHDELHRSMTKAFKWGVNWGVKNLDLTIISSDNISVEHVEAFRLLHLDAAGRETRSRRSWEMQHAMIVANEAFCGLGWLEGQLVTAALFPHSSAHCFYGVSASRRELFDKPLSHAVIWTAMLHAKKMGIKCFEMGEQVFPSTGSRQPTAKELSISFFKRAFGGATKAYLDIRLSKREVGRSVSASAESCAS